MEGYTARQPKHEVSGFREHLLAACGSCTFKTNNNWKT